MRCSNYRCPAFSDDLSAIEYPKAHLHAAVAVFSRTVKPMRFLKKNGTLMGIFCPDGMKIFPTSNPATEGLPMDFTGTRSPSVKYAGLPTTLYLGGYGEERFSPQRFSTTKVVLLGFSNKNLPMILFPESLQFSWCHIDIFDNYPKKFVEFIHLRRMHTFR